MVWDVQVRDENGEVIPHGGAVIDFALPSSPFFRFVDPYGNTIFNRVQMENFLREWETVKVFADTPEREKNWAKVRDYAVEVRDNAHIYLWFIGD